MRVMIALLALACGSSLAQLPDSQVYRGEIRRDADGKLVAVPPPARTETQSVQPAPKPAAANATHKPQPSSARPALPPESGSALPRTLRVGPEQQIRSISVAAAMAKDGDTIEIEAGDYLGDVAWDTSAETRQWYARIKSRPAFRTLLNDRIAGMPAAAGYADLDF